MFVVFRRDAYEKIGGFDARRFFMYCEDIDICERLRSAGWRVVFQPETFVIHDAQRASRRSLRHLRWHSTSMLRYLLRI
ncbi:glycosyltransferase family 2 protein [Roseateles sp. GG27B]